MVQAGICMGKPVQVWQVPLAVSDDIVQAYFQCLSADERLRAERFRFDRDRRRFVVARGTLRHLLAKELGQTPESIDFCYGEYGKPSVPTVTNGDFHFNVSHSGELALCALGYQYRVGVDVEKIKDIQRLDGMMGRCLLATEQAAVNADDNPLRAFLQRWTCKEAYLKAIGMGLIQSMTSVEVQLTPPMFAEVPQGQAKDWHLSVMNVPEDYVAALATEGIAEVVMLNWQHSVG